MSAGKKQEMPGADVVLAGAPGLALLAERLVDAARSSGVQLIGLGGLLSGLTNQVLETALRGRWSSTWATTAWIHPVTVAGTPAMPATPKTVRTDIGEVRIDVPRDRGACVRPKVVPKHTRHLTGVDQVVISLHAKGMPTGEHVQPPVRGVGTEVMRELVSKITNAVVLEMTSWASQPLASGVSGGPHRPNHDQDSEGHVANRPVYVTVGIGVDGHRDMLGIWAGPSGGKARSSG